ncbi:MAG: TonB-dependent receptor [Deltaproteobacteria bacterium]|nr:TonB-dependent receptor [Deltaproteobacteria bacterium]
MKYLIGLLGIFIVLPILASTVVLAQITSELKPVEVIGHPIEEKLSAELAAYGHEVKVIDGKTLENMGFVDLSDALPVLAPGLFISAKGRGDYASYMMNGNTGVLWLMDGIRLNNRLYGSAYMDTLSVHMIERIEVLYGGEGLFYGTDATSGVINIITKKPTDEPHGKLGLSYGTGPYVATNGWVSDRVGPIKLLFFASYEDWEGYKPFKDKTYQDFGNQERRKREFDRLNFGLKLNADFGDNAEKRFNLHLQRNSGGFDFAYPQFRSALNDREEYIATAKWDHDVTSNYSYFVKIYLHTWWTEYTRLYLDGSYSNNKSIWGYEDWGINFLNSYRFDRGDEILFGLDYQNYWGKDEVLLIKSQHEEAYAIFAQFRPYFAFWPSWKLALGVRYNRSGEEDATIWNISSRMPFFNDRMYLRANIGTSFTLPTAEQLYAIDPDETGNPNLKPEESFALNLGLGFNNEVVSAEISYFYEKIKNQIGYEANYVFQNVEDETIINGYTISGTVRPIKSLALSAAYTWQRSKTEGQIDLRRLPEDFATITLQWNDDLAGVPVGLGIYAKYFGKTYTTFANYPALINAGAREYYSAYWVADVSLYAQITERSRISLYLGNVFDKSYETAATRARRDPQDDSSPYIYYGLLANPFSATLTYSYEF